ncbi:MAG: hypothetical protein QOG67_55, partial [Verrucomicrobiota bacterium]
MQRYLGKQVDRKTRIRNRKD